MAQNIVQTLKFEPLSNKIKKRRFNALRLYYFDPLYNENWTLEGGSCISNNLNSDLISYMTLVLCRA